jgi:hypothetical protein
MQEINKKFVRLLDCNNHLYDGSCIKDIPESGCCVECPFYDKF